ncbi:MAG: 4-hydroxybutyrate--acetyl-CoA CoA transferase, partial [Bacillota bacterium]
MAKTITIQEALEKIQNHDHIVQGMAAAEGREFFSHLHEIADRVDHVTIDNCLPLKAYPFMTEAQYKDTFTINSWFFSGDLRKAFKNGNITYIPNHLHFAGVKRAQHIKPDV